MSVIFSYKSRKRRKRSSGFLRNWLLILISCLVAYQCFYYAFPLKSKDLLNGRERIIDSKSLRNIENKIAAKIKPDVIIPLNVKGNSVKHSQLPLLAASQPNSKLNSNGKQHSGNVQLTDEIKQIINKADNLVREHKIIEARELLNRAIDNIGLKYADNELISKAIKIGAKTVFSEYVYDDDPLASRYRVKPGDVMAKIARKCNVPYKLICRINHITNPRKLRAGQKIKLVFGPIHGKVIMHKLILYLYMQDVIIASYKVGLGKNNKTPEGMWIVSDKVFRPVYCDPDTGKTYAPDDPDNPTGGYWIRLKGIAGDALGKSGFGIHGTNEPESIGKFMSKGCIRLRNEDMSEVFDMLKAGLSKIETIR